MFQHFTGSEQKMSSFDSFLTGTQYFKILFYVCDKQEANSYFNVADIIKVQILLRMQILDTLYSPQMFSLVFQKKS